MCLDFYKKRRINFLTYKRVRLMTQRFFEQNLCSKKYLISYCNLLILCIVLKCMDTIFKRLGNNGKEGEAKMFFFSHFYKKGNTTI